MTDNDSYDTTEKLEETETGYRLTVSCKRGTGTRDQDKVKATAKAETLEQLANEQYELLEQAESSMEFLRGIQPDGGSDE